MSADFSRRPTVALKSKLLDTVTGISATETDATIYDLRGMIDLAFTFLSTLNTGFMTGSVFFKGSVVGCDTSVGTFVPINGLETAELVVDVAQTVPSTTNAQSVVMPRFAKVKWTETGAMTSFTGTARLWYNRMFLGPNIDHGAVS